MKKYHPPGFVGVIAIVHSPGSFAPAQKSSRLLLKRGANRNRMHPACAPVRTRTGLLGFYSSHPEIIRQIEGAGEAFFEADWDGDQLGIGRRVPDQDW
jgi:hypothetical protein